MKAIGGVSVAAVFILVFATVASAAAEATPYAVLLAAAKHVVEFFRVKAIGEVLVAAVVTLLLRPVADATGKGF